MGFAQQLRKIAEKRKVDVSNLMRASLLQVGNRIIVSSPFDEGRFKNNWHTFITNIGNSAERANDISGQLSISALTSEIQKLNPGDDLFFVNQLPYSYRIEYEGWSQKAPAGVVRINVSQFSKIVEQAASFK